MDKLLYWSDIPGLYSGVVWTLFLLLMGVALLPVFEQRWTKPLQVRKIAVWLRMPGLFLLLTALFLFAARWPGLFYFTSFNVDEAQMLAAAQALTHDPLFFRAAECGSSGPMVVYPLLSSLLFGQAPSYFSARVVGLTMLFGTACAFYGIARLVMNESIARIGTLIPVTLFGFTYYWDFVHYTSEHAPVFFLFVGLFFTAQVALARGLSWTRLVVFAVLGALCFSIVPFAKLQGTDLAMFSGLLLVAAVFLRPGNGLRRRLIACGITVAAALLFPACLVAVVAMGGALDYFIQSYFGNALAYQAAGIPGVSSWQMLGALLGKSQDAAIYAAGLCVFVLVATASLLAPSPIALSKRIAVFLAVTFLLTVLAFSAVLATQRDYGHYLIFLPFFSALFVSGLAGALVDRGRSVRTTPRAAANYELTCVGLLILTSIFPVVGFRLENPQPWVGSARSWSEKSAAPHTGPGNAIRNIGKDSNRRLAVWGYVPEFYIESGMIQATRLSTSSAIFNDNHLRTFFLTTYLEDLERSAPDLFVDAVAEGQFMMNDPATHGHETVPEIADYVRRNYELVREVRRVRIFRRLPSPREPSATSNEL